MHRTKLFLRSLIASHVPDMSVKNINRRNVSFSVSPESVIDAVDRVLAACGQDKFVHNDKAIAEA